MRYSPWVAESDMTESDMTPTYCYGGCPVQRRMSSSTSGLYPLEGDSQCDNKNVSHQMSPRRQGCPRLGTTGIE